MTIKAVLAELKEAQEDLKAIARLADTTDVRAAKKKAQSRLKALAEMLSQEDFEFEVERLHYRVRFKPLSGYAVRRDYKKTPEGYAEALMFFWKCYESLKKEVNQKIFNGGNL